MYSVKEFIKWALTHVDPESIPEGASLPLPLDECGVEPWHYLYGTVRSRTTRDKIAERWQNYYITHGWSKEAYDYATASFREHDYATDCQGLLDAFLTCVIGEYTDINAHMNYADLCTGKGKLDEIDRPYILGEALFFRNKNTGRMSHVGWVCGFLADEPLVVEARGLRYGVVVTKLSERPWTHRGLMTKKFNYESEEDTPMDRTKFEVKSPMLNGECITAMQRALNVNGYTDPSGKQLAEDGKWGSKSQAAFEKMLAEHSDKPSEGASRFCINSEDGLRKMVISVTEAEAI